MKKVHVDVVNHLVYNYFRSQKIKVSFGASGADELFGGYEAYKNIDWNSKVIKKVIITSLSLFCSIVFLY